MIRDDTFVVTLRMDEVSFARLDVLRTRYFPPDINSLPAHLTLFYALTDEQVSRFSEIPGPPICPNISGLTIS